MTFGSNGVKQRKPDHRSLGAFLLSVPDLVALYVASTGSRARAGLAKWAAAHLNRTLLPAEEGLLLSALRRKFQKKHRRRRMPEFVRERVGI